MMKLGATLVDPRTIYFESDVDVIDYISGGMFPPTKTKYEMVMEAIQNPENSEVRINQEQIRDPQILLDMAERVYKNRCKQRNTMLAIAGGVATVILVAKLKGHHDKKDDDCSDSGKHSLVAIGDELIEPDLPDM